MKRAQIVGVLRPPGAGAYVRLPIALLSVLEAALCFPSLASAQTVRPQAQQSTGLALPTAESPANLEQLPPSAPTITYENGELTISAFNSTLSDILRAISKETGADIDIPPQAEERVVTRLGPGPAHDVLRSLLAGSQFDYVIVGSTADPTAIATVLLRLRPANTDNRTANKPVQETRLQSPETEVVAESVPQQDNSQEQSQSWRAQQDMLQKHRQSVIEGFQQNQQPR